MDASLREVIHTPLDEIWDERGSFGRLVRHLTKEQMGLIVSEGPLRLIEAEVGLPLRWIPASECFQHWKAVRDNVANPEGFYLENVPGEVAFLASEWEGRQGERLTVLEKHH